MDNTILLLIGAIILVAVLLLLLRRASGGEAISAEIYRDLQQQNEALRRTLVEKERELRDATATIAAQEQSLIHQREMLKRLPEDFEQLASRLLEVKSQRFTEQSAQHLDQLLTPLREKIRDFEESLERKFSEEMRDKASLKKEIEQLLSLNQQLSQDARNLTNALKGDTKVQGNWGEMQLEVLLERAGLQKGEHFEAQITLTSDDGQLKRPDFVVRLPNQRHLVIDAKVSLTAFERYFNAEDAAAREQHLKAHVDSLRRHVQALSSKSYSMLPKLKAPDFVILFVPIEGALSAAIQADTNLLSDAFNKNVVIATNTTLAAIVRIVSHLWRQEKQNRSAEEIARQSGLLYDKLVAFLEDLRSIGTRLDQAHQAYSDAMRKLSAGTRPGDTLIGRAERIRELGAKTTRQIPPDFVEDVPNEEADSAAGNTT